MPFTSIERPKQGLSPNRNKMKTIIEANELAPLVDFINDSYVGDLATASNDLRKAVYMLHYIEPGSVTESEIKDVCFALHHMSQRLFTAYKNRINIKLNK